jgi:hypothetical protein
MAHVSVTAQPDGLPQLSVQEALKRLVETRKVPLVAWLGDPELGVDWEQGDDLEKTLFRLSLAAPAVWETKDGVLVFSMPPFRPDEVSAVPLHVNLIRERAVFERLPEGMVPWLLSGKEVLCRDLPDDCRALLRAYVRERTVGSPAPWSEAYEHAVAEGSIQLFFTPALTLCSLLADRMPGELVMDLPVWGEGPKTALDWRPAITWLRFTEEKECTPAKLGGGRVAVDPGLYKLAELAELIGATDAARLHVAPEYDDRQVYVNVPSTPAAELAALLARACRLKLCDAEGVPTLGTTYPFGDRFRLHDDNMEWLLEWASVLTVLPRGSVAAQFAAACLPRNDAKLDDLPPPLREALKRISASRPEAFTSDTVVRLIPAFSLRFHSPGAGVYGLEIK